MVAIAGTKPTVGELLQSLSRETGMLVKQEVQLASTELRHKAIGGVRDLGMMTGGAALVQVGLLVLISAAVLGLAPWVPMWGSALALGSLVFVAGVALSRSGLAALQKFDPTLTATMRTLQDDRAWVKEQLR